MAAFLRCFRLGHQSLWVDEAFSLGMAVVGRPLTGAQLVEDIHGPLYTLLLHVWTSFAGNSEWALRFPAALLGVLTVPLLGWVASMWLGRKVAVPAMWLAAGSPFLVWYGQEARNYALVIFCSCASAAALLSLRRKLAVGGIVVYWLTAAAGMLSNFSFTFLGPLHFAWWLGEPGHRVRRFWLGAAMVAMLGLAVSPWLPQVRGTWSLTRLWPGPAEDGPALRGETTFHPWAVPFALHSFAVGYTLGPPLRELKQGTPTMALRRHLPEVFAVAAVFGALGALGLAALARRRRLIQGLLWVAVPLLLLSYAALSNVKVFHPRYAAVAMPGFLLILAAGLADLGPRRRALFGLAIAALWAVSLQHHYFVPRYGKEDMRSAAALIERRGSAGERVIAANSETVLVYYYRGPLPVRTIWIGDVSHPDRLTAHLQAALAGARGAWVVLSRPEDLDPRDEFARTLDVRYPDAERFHFEGVRIWHLVTSTAAPGGAVRGSPGT